MELWLVAVIIVAVLILSYAFFLVSLWNLLRALLSFKKDADFDVFSSSDPD